MPYNPEGRVFVGNLQDGISADDLLRVFKKYGPIAEVVVKVNCRCAFVVFENRADAVVACEYMDGTWLLGINIAVRMANERVEDRNAAEQQQLQRRLHSYRPRGGWKSQLPPDRRRPRMRSNSSASRVNKGRSRNVFDPDQIYGREFQSSAEGGQNRPSSAAETRAPEVGKGSGAVESKDYRLVVNNMSSTIKWSEIDDFLQKEAGLSLTEDEHRRDFDKSFYVDFTTRRCMEDAMKKLDGLEIAGKTVRVYIDDRPRGRKE